MTKKVIDGIIKDWGEQLYSAPVKGRKGKNVRSGGSTTAPTKASGPATREKVARTANKAPEVMVKISGGGKNMKHIKAHMDYISRNGEVEIEDENGDLHKGVEAVRDVRDAWAKGKIGIPYIVLSMPPGTDRQSVKDAAREFAKEQFGNHQYVFAAHDDEKHPHVHLAVKAVGHDGIRLNPRKGDLQFWREQFAEKLRDQGIEANATPRRARGIVQKAEKQAVRHIDREHAAGKRKAPARVTASQWQEAQQEAQGGPSRANPAQSNIEADRKGVQRAYGQIARELAKGDGDDKRLAVDIVKLVQQMPLPLSRHGQRVQALQEAARSRVESAGKELGRRPGVAPERTAQLDQQKAQKPEQGREI
jgi:hypothetical protein